MFSNEIVFAVENILRILFLLNYQRSFHVSGLYFFLTSIVHSQIAIDKVFLLLII